MSRKKGVDLRTIAREATEREAAVLQKLAEHRRPLGPLAESASRMPLQVIRHARGPHSWLCRIGVHAWEQRTSMRAGLLLTGETVERCAVCAIWRS